MKFDDNEITSVADLLACLSEQMPSDAPTWFRGHADHEWRLTCSLERFGGIDREMSLIKRFKQNAYPIISDRPESEWEWLFVMQHHGLPTRLLDWSESALVALYFAVNGDDPGHEASAGCLWALLPLGLNANAKLESSYTSDIPGLGDDEHLNEYLPSRLRMQPQPLKPLASIAMRNTPRIQMQQGVFTVFHKDLTELDKQEGNDFLWRLVIPSESKARIRKELALLGITKLALFPELTNVSEHARGLSQ